VWPAKAMAANGIELAASFRVVEAARGRKAVNSKQTNNLFIPTSISENFTALELVPGLRGYNRLLIQTLSNYQINRIESIEYTGRLLAALARKAQIARRMDIVEQASRLMLALPLSEQLKGVAIFYQGTCKQGGVEFDRRLFEQAAEIATPQYRARALLSIGTTYWGCGEAESAMPYCLAAGKAAAGRDLLTQAESQWMIAVIRSVQGNHKQALGDLENLFPLVRTVSKHYPALYYDYLNSLAVEFGEVGRIAEAESAISIALSSPFASAYPEWSQTRDEIEQKRNYPDPSRCFLDRTLTESEVASDSNPKLLTTTYRHLEAAHLPQRQSEVEVKPLRRTVFPAFLNQTTCQGTPTLPNASLAIIPGGSAQSILQRLVKSIQPRSPPNSLTYS
jgi:hypothetical protein